MCGAQFDCTVPMSDEDLRRDCFRVFLQAAAEQPSSQLISQEKTAKIIQVLVTPEEAHKKLHGFDSTYKKGATE